MAGHLEITASTGMSVYFCEPRSPWQRGTNENSNGLLRDYFPKRRTSPSTPQNVSPRSRTSSTTAHERPSGGSPQLLHWQSYSRRVHEPLLRCSLESAPSFAADSVPITVELAGITRVTTMDGSRTGCANRRAVGVVDGPGRRRRGDGCRSGRRGWRGLRCRLGSAGHCRLG